MQSFLLALSDPLRRDALRILSNGGEHCVCELMAKLDVSQSRMSRNMKTLRKEGLVVSRQDAQWVRYRQNPALSPALKAVVEAVLTADTPDRRNVA